MRFKCFAQGLYCRCQQIWTRDLTVESLWSYLLSHDSSANDTVYQTTPLVTHYSSEVHHAHSTVEPHYKEVRYIPKPCYNKVISLVPALYISLYLHPQIRRNLIQWNLVIQRSDITKPSYNKVILLVPALYIILFVLLPWYNEKPDITR